MNQKEINDWINSLNPVVIQLDEQGNMSPLGLEALDQRIREGVNKVREKSKPSEPDSEPSEPDS